jgi:hypothetical protein
MKHAFDLVPPEPAAPTPPRHARLFELIRQKNQADTTVARLKGHSIRKIGANEFLQMQRAAARSLQARPSGHA